MDFAAAVAAAMAVAVTDSDVRNRILYGANHLLELLLSVSKYCLCNKADAALSHTCNNRFRFISASPSIISDKTPLYEIDYFDKPVAIGAAGFFFVYRRMGIEIITILVKISSIAILPLRGVNACSSANILANCLVCLFCQFSCSVT